MITSWLISGLPRQFCEMKENRRCSILFHLLVPGGKRQTLIVSRVVSASRCSSVFHRRRRLPFEPPQSAVIVSVVACGERSRPRCSHQPWIEAVANWAVLLSIPTETQPSS